MKPLTKVNNRQRWNVHLLTERSEWLNQKQLKSEKQPLAGWLIATAEHQKHN